MTPAASQRPRETTGRQETDQTETPVGAHHHESWLPGLKRQKVDMAANRMARGRSPRFVPRQLSAASTLRAIAIRRLLTSRRPPNHLDELEQPDDRGQDQHQPEERADELAHDVARQGGARAHRARDLRIVSAAEPRCAPSIKGRPGECQDLSGQDPHAGCGALSRHASRPLRNNGAPFVEPRPDRPPGHPIDRTAPNGLSPLHARRVGFPRAAPLHRLYSPPRKARRHEDLVRPPRRPKEGTLVVGVLEGGRLTPPRSRWTEAHWRPGRPSGQGGAALRRQGGEAAGNAGAGQLPVDSVLLIGLGEAGELDASRPSGSGRNSIPGWPPRAETTATVRVDGIAAARWMPPPWRRRSRPRPVAELPLRQVPARREGRRQAPP